MDYPFPTLAECMPPDLGHPYLFARREELHALREKCRTGAAAREYAAIRDHVLRAVDGDGIPPSPRRDECRYGGDFERWIFADRDAKLLLSNAAFVALVEDDADLAERTYGLAHDFMCWPSWTHPQLPWHAVDLRTAGTLQVMAMVYDFLFDRLSRDRRVELESTCWARGIRRMKEELESQPWATAYESNWCAVCCEGVAAAALAFANGGEQDRASYLDLADRCARHVWRYLDSYGTGGAWREGVTYWGYGTGLALTLAHTLRSVSGGAINLFEHPAVADIAEFPMRCHLAPDKVVNFGDCYSHPWLTPANLKVAQERRDGRHLWYFRTQQEYYRTNQMDVFRVLWWPDDLEEKEPTVDPPSMHFPRIGWTIFRADGRDPDELVVPVKIGTTLDPHGHADVGTFLVHAGGHTFIRDFGIPRYGDPRSRIFRQTEGHNLARPFASPDRDPPAVG